jgi:hypothetical protein
VVAKITARYAVKNIKPVNKPRAVLDAEFTASRAASADWTNSLG